MSTIKVAILNRPRDGKGGDLVGIGNRMAALRKWGVDVEYVDGEPLVARLGCFDVAHIFHIDFWFSWANFEAVLEAGIPYVVTPVFYPECSGMTHDQKVMALRNARAILPYSKTEGEELRARFGDWLQYTAIPSGTGPEFHAMNGTREGVCAVDQADWKNTPIIERACASLGLPFTWFRDVPHEQMPAEYRKHKVFATATGSDRMSLAVGEALCSGCRVLASDANRGNEWYPKISSVPRGSSVEFWADLIWLAHESDSWDWTPNEAARKLTWEAQAAGYKAAYERALAA